MIPFLRLIWSADSRVQIPADPKKILFLRVGALGDVIMTTPALDAIHKRFPQAAIDFACGEWSAPMLAHHPAIAQLIPFADSWVFEKRFGEMRRFASQLRRNKYDLAFFFDKSWHWSVFASQTHIACSVGFDRRGEGFGYNIRIPYVGEKAEYFYNLDIASAAGCPVPVKIRYSIHPSDADKKQAAAFMSRYKLSRFIGIAPGGANNPGHVFHEKRWPKENYISLISNLSKNKIVLFGGKDDKTVCDGIIASHPSLPIVSCAGELSALASVALMQKAALFITHDSGALHMAASTGCPLLALFGPTPPSRFAPPGVRIIYPFRGKTPCYDIYGSMKKCTHSGKCMNAISVDTVTKAALEMLS